MMGILITTCLAGTYMVASSATLLPPNGPLADAASTLQNLRRHFVSLTRVMTTLKQKVASDA
jgi:hypothetical protein